MHEPDANAHRNFIAVLLSQHVEELYGSGNFFYDGRRRVLCPEKSNDVNFSLSAFDVVISERLLRGGIIMVKMVVGRIR